VKWETTVAKQATTVVKPAQSEGGAPGSDGAENPGLVPVVFPEIVIPELLA
jgi:hypothetical protein